MRVDKIQSNLPLVGADLRPTPITQEAFEKLVREVLALRAAVDDHEARLTGGGL